MSFRARIRAGFGLCTMVLASCDGSSLPTGMIIPDGGGSSIERPRSMTPDVGVADRRDTSLPSPVDLRLPEAGPDRPPPTINPMVERVVPGRARLVGGHQVACSGQVPATGDGSRWCAFSLPGAQLGSTELWVLNVTRAAAARGSVKCDGNDPNCRRLTANLWTGEPDQGPTHPTAHRFDGDTLIFHADAPAGLDFYEGPIYAWRPDWERPRQITGARGVTCVGHGRTDVVTCIENFDDAVPPTQFDLHAGRLADGRPPKIARITPLRANQASQWRSAFNRSGDTFAYSTGGRTIQERETLYVMKTADVSEIAANPSSPKKIEVGAGISRWNISLDSKKVYFFRSYNYNVDGEPQGTLTMADFPDGQNEVTLAGKVGAYQLLGDGTDADRGLGYFDNIMVGKGSFKIVKDRDKPQEVVSVVSNIGGAIVSRNQRWVYFIRDFDEMTGTADAYVAKADGSGACTLTSRLEADLYGNPFPNAANLVMWADKVDTVTGVGEGWVAGADGCAGRRKFSDGMDYWFWAGDQGLVYSDQGDIESASLKYALVSGSSQLGTPVRIQDGIRRLYALVPGFRAALFAINLGVAGIDGLYLYKDFPFEASPADGGAPDSAPPVPPDAAPAPPDATRPDLTGDL